VWREFTVLSFLKRKRINPLEKLLHISSLTTANHAIKKSDLNILRRRANYSDKIGMCQRRDRWNLYLGSKINRFWISWSREIPSGAVFSKNIAKILYEKILYNIFWIFYKKPKHLSLNHKKLTTVECEKNFI